MNDKVDDLVQDILLAQKQLANGEGVDHAKAKSIIMKRF